MKPNLFRGTVVACFVMFAGSCCYARSAESATREGGAQIAATNTKTSDRALAYAVRGALGRAPGFDVSGVFVRVRGGNVTLSGSVPSGDQIAEAGSVARSVEGVNSVSNALTMFHGGHG